MAISSMCRRGAHQQCTNAQARCDCDAKGCPHGPGQIPPAPGGGVKQGAKRVHQDKYAGKVEDPGLDPDPVPPKEPTVARTPAPPEQQAKRTMNRTRQIELVEEVPPRKYDVTTDIEPLLDEMKANVWYRVVTFGSKSAAATAKKKVAARWDHLQLEAGPFEDGSGLWAMVPDGTAEDGS